MGPITGASMNPARSLAPALVAGGLRRPLDLPGRTRARRPRRRRASTRSCATRGTPPSPRRPRRSSSTRRQRDDPGEHRPRAAARPDHRPADRRVRRASSAVETVERFTRETFEKLSETAPASPTFLPLFCRPLHARPAAGARPGRRPDRQGPARGALRVRPQRRPLADGRAAHRAPERGPGQRPLGRVGSGRPGQPAGRRGDGRARARHVGTSSRSRSPTRSCAPPTPSSRWAAATRARSTPASGTRTGTLSDPADAESLDGRCG